jgi:XTP/dITP diphosphohydrolase
MKKLIIATANPGKIDEFRNILGSDEFDFYTMKQVGFTDEIIENGSSFAENALLKAKAVHDFCGESVLADDSGLEVRALHWAPGIYSARFAGEHATDEQNNQKLLQQLNHVEDRFARFTCCLCFIGAKSTYNEPPQYFEGHCPGLILKEPQGQNGFGYDPLFMPLHEIETSQSPRSFGQMDYLEKKAISHRGEAIRQFKNWLNS